ncbi:MAG: xanthine dehydrogenase family protein molybdopterin-binding subunit, partial [Solirubrobacterales bacterium]
MAAVDAYVGQPLPRVEDLRLITGAGAYVADISRDGQLYARIVRSEVPYGRLRGINAERALAREGVEFVMTADDIDEHRIPIRILSAPAGEAALQTPLTADYVRYVGDPVAVVVADDPYLAEDAAEDVEVDIEPLEAVLEARDSIAAEAPILHAALGTNVVGSESATQRAENIDELLSSADVVVRKRFRVQRQGSVPLEPRGFVAEWEPDLGRVSLWGAAKVKHFNRRVLAAMLDLDVEAVRVIEGDVGGGFGARGEFYPEDFLIPWLSIKLERPV